MQPILRLIHLLDCFDILEAEENNQNEVVVEENVGLKLVTQPETPLRS